MLLQGQRNLSIRDYLGHRNHISLSSRHLQAHPQSHGMTSIATSRRHKVRVETLNYCSGGFHPVHLEMSKFCGLRYPEGGPPLFPSILSLSRSPTWYQVIQHVRLSGVIGSLSSLGARLVLGFRYTTLYSICYNVT